MYWYRIFLSFLIFAFNRILLIEEANALRGSVRVSVDLVDIPI